MIAKPLALALILASGVASSAQAQHLRGVARAGDDTFEIRCTDASYCGPSASEEAAQEGTDTAQEILGVMQKIDGWTDALGFGDPHFQKQSHLGKRQIYITNDTFRARTDGCSGSSPAACVSSLPARGAHVSDRVYELRVPKGHIDGDEREFAPIIAHEYFHTFVRANARRVNWVNEAAATALETGWGVKQGFWGNNRLTEHNVGADVPFHQNPYEDLDSYGYGKSRYFIKMGQELGAKDNVSHLKKFFDLKDDKHRGMSYLYEDLPEKARFNKLFPKFVADLNEVEVVNYDDNIVRLYNDDPEAVKTEADTGAEVSGELSRSVEPFSALPLDFSEITVKGNTVNTLMYGKYELVEDPDHGDMHLVYEDQVMPDNQVLFAYAADGVTRGGFVRLVNAPESYKNAKARQATVRVTHSPIEFQLPKCVLPFNKFTVTNASGVDFSNLNNVHFSGTTHVGGVDYIAGAHGTIISVSALVGPPNSRGPTLGTRVAASEMTQRAISVGTVKVTKHCKPKWKFDWDFPVRDDKDGWCNRLRRRYIEIANAAGDAKASSILQQMAHMPALGPWVNSLAEFEDDEGVDSACKMTFQAIQHIPMSAFIE